MAQKAYILFYIKRQPGGKRPPSSARPPSAAPSPAAVPSPATAAPSPAAVPAPQRQQDVQQPPAAVGRQQAAEAAALLAGAAAVPRPPSSGKAAKAAAAAAAADGGSKKRRREAEAAAAAAAAAVPSSPEQEALPSAKRHQHLLQNGRISKKARLRALRGTDEEAHAASPLRCVHCVVLWRMMMWCGFEVLVRKLLRLPCVVCAATASLAGPAQQPAHCICRPAALHLAGT